ncbi:hypothetical protein B296_00021912 [Ensete ventricosum]|uniref:Uncharacterized protein n=1 Tax=Ensete ventricosum TaxID=4639 RepID=A0A427AVL9_ENSVE|nr:hypothetical protein B296_00021912 [Ensete ventricosum]
MTAQVTREWAGIQQFPAATQNKLHELLGKLKQEVCFIFFCLDTLEFISINLGIMLLSLECEHIDNSGDGKGWSREVIHSQLHFRGEGGFCQCFSGNYCQWILSLPSLLMLVLNPPSLLSSSEDVADLAFLCRRLMGSTT